MADSATWSVPQCPFKIEYAPPAFDEIRRIVSDAFFSLPRGGAEIGGILLGKFENGSLSITSFMPLDCEHAYGPSFILSPNDLKKLLELIAGPHPSDLQVAGWYHSHTRSEIFLTDADCAIHTQFFPEPWQVALVLKPHLLLPTRAGFFFREAAGAIHSKDSYREFVLEPLQPLPSREPADTRAAARTSTPQAPSPQTPSPQTASRPAAPPADVPGAPAPPVTSQTAIPSALHEQLPPLSSRSWREHTPRSLPRFLQDQPPAAGWPQWPRIALLLIVGAALGAAAYWWRDFWIPGVMAMTGSPAPPTPPPASLGLNTLDLGGELQIRWNRDSSALAQASQGTLRLTGAEGQNQPMSLDRAHLLSGVMTMSRQSARVDISLCVNQVKGKPVCEATSYIGSPPPKITDQGDADAAVQQREAALADQLARIRADLDAEIDRNRRLQRDVDSLAKQIYLQQRSRTKLP